MGFSYFFKIGSEWDTDSDILFQQIIWHLSFSKTKKEAKAPRLQIGSGSLYDEP